MLDASVLIDAKNTYYAFDICPGFWRAISRHHELGRVFSIDKVKKELIQPISKELESEGIEEDQLSIWVRKSMPASFFKATSSADVAAEYKAMVNWVQNSERFLPEAKEEFARVADGWLVAFAKTNRVIVVTREVPAPSSKKEVKIPDVCMKFGVQYCDTYDFLRNLKEKFVLKKRIARK